ncbi:MAG: hypothetical protein QM667_02115 [Asticcacaulis sp.]
MKRMDVVRGWIMAGVLGGGLIIGGLIGYDRNVGTGLFSRNSFMLQSLVVVALLLVLAFSIVWWRSIDEAQKEAHKWAWYWGGSTGLLVALFAYIITLVGGDAAFMDYVRLADHEGRLLSLGILTAFVPSIVGYGIAWGVWWLRHR